MVSEELQIGDWIKDDYDYTQVDYLESNNINGHPTDWYEPIPLTEEILEKNGIIKRIGDCWGYVCDDFEIRVNMRYKEYLRIIICDGADQSEDHEYSFPYPKYLHQFQHALNMCGIDKEIIP